MRLNANPVCGSTSVNKQKKGEYYLWELGSENLGAPHRECIIWFLCYRNVILPYLYYINTGIWPRMCANAWSASLSRNRIEYRAVRLVEMEQRNFTHIIRCVRMTTHPVVII